MSYLQFGYLAGKEGLLAGEKLYLDVKRMEMAYHDLNQREYELAKHASVLQVDPLALIQLRTTGRCTVRLPESLFDMDGPGHYFRRIKTVAVSIPCVTGPYASVNCTLTLLKSSIRKTPVVGDQYARVDADDDRFSDYFGSLQSIVTSSGQNDSGLFETNMRDERYLPFENSGAISEWQFQLPANPSNADPTQFGYESISDVILHLRYSAREGGALSRNGAVSHLKQLITEAQAAGSVRLFSLRHEFPTEWARFLNDAPAANQRRELALKLRTEHFPFWSMEIFKNKGGQLSRVEFLARSSQSQVPASVEVAEKRTDQPNTPTKVDALNKDPALGDLLVGSLTNIPLPARLNDDRDLFELKLYPNTAALSDMWLAVTWQA